eukprot:TRINITY_DN401_c0_g2_i1.p1 TRINITY_DN401_c0_g2~~TRINITY_DN401_c0_g2_i1.p1  ORF type:complete len:224 (-),score=84.23 TRINITY_DN401_c0_g2_i1:275-946(-)
MRSEISSAAQWWSSSLCESISQEAKAIFAQQLTTLLEARFLGHWYTENPIKGQAYRSLVYDPEYAVVDDALRMAAERAGIADIKQVLEKSVSAGVRMWIDPDEVTVENVKGKANRKTVFQGRSASPPPRVQPRFSSRGLFTADDYVAEQRKMERMKANVHRAHFVPSAGYPGQAQNVQQQMPFAQQQQQQQQFMQYHQYERAQSQHSLPLQGRGPRRTDQLAY